jgi:hypothetical protein
MTTENELEVYKAILASQNKYTYFMLTAAGAAIAFAITQTKDATISWSQIPLAVAIACWVLSFFAGCLTLRSVSDVLHFNADLLEVWSGNHPLAGNHPQKMAIGVEVIREAIERKGFIVSRYDRLQFAALIAGAICYVIWHIIEMSLRVAPVTATSP